MSELRNGFSVHDDANEISIFREINFIDKSDCARFGKCFGQLLRYGKIVDIPVLR